MGSLSRVNMISKRATEIIEEIGCSVTLAIDMAYKEIMKPKGTEEDGIE